MINPKTIAVGEPTGVVQKLNQKSMGHIALMYHDVYNRNPNESGLASDMYKIGVEQFEKQIISICESKKHTSHTIVLTFDDGGSSFYDPISRILDKYALRGYFFVATKYIGEAGFLTKEQIVDMDKRGHHVGSHSYSHPENLSALSQKEIEYEWQESVQTLSKILNHPVVMGSIPNGYQSKAVLDAANKAGITQLFTSKPTCKETKYKDVSLTGRYVILNGMSEEDVLNLILSKNRRRLLLSKWFVLRVPKLLLGNKYEVVKQKIIG